MLRVDQIIQQYEYYKKQQQSSSSSSGPQNQSLFPSTENLTSNQTNISNVEPPVLASIASPSSPNKNFSALNISSNSPVHREETPPPLKLAYKQQFLQQITPFIQGNASSELYNLSNKMVLSFPDDELSFFTIGEMFSHFFSMTVCSFLPVVFLFHFCCSILRSSIFLFLYSALSFFRFSLNFLPFFFQTLLSCPQTPFFLSFRVSSFRLLLLDHK
jgi:hypothetical protein